MAPCCVAHDMKSDSQEEVRIPVVQCDVNILLYR